MKEVPSFINSFTYTNFNPHRLPKSSSSFEQRRALEEVEANEEEESNDEQSN